MTGDRRMLEAALRYAQQGWAVFPVYAPTDDGACACERGAACAHPGKHPMGELAPRGHLDATTDPDVITRWWAAQPGANIGGVPKASGLVVIDIDQHDADGFATWQALRAERPGLDCDTVTARTGGGGVHLFYEAPADFKPVGKLGPGIDVKHNGYVVLPPSKHASGQVYGFEPGHNPVKMRPAALPDALRELLTRANGNGHNGNGHNGNGNGRAAATSPQDQGETAGEVERAGDEYNRTHTWRDVQQDLLEPRGWKIDRESNGVFGLTRPHKDRGISAEAGGDKDIMYVYSTAPEIAPFEPEVSYTKFGVYTLLEHGGDFRAAARSLYEERERANGSTARTAAGSSPAGGEDGEPRSRRVKSADLVKLIQGWGYAVRLNVCDDSIECNGERLSDVVRAQIRTRLRDVGLGKHLAAAEDALLAHASEKPFHPVRSYLEERAWDGHWHISRLAQHFEDIHHVFGTYFRKWLIGAVARAYTGRQNAVLVLDGPQGVGKSQFARWLCPLPGMFVDGGIQPDEKDSALLAIRSWIWEVSELGATTRRADVESLKGFLSRELFTLRPAYGHYEIVKPALANFIGTVNNSAGVFSDPTGSRRFWATTVTAIDWSYRERVDVHQVWAEAFAAYRDGEASTLTAEEAAYARQINESYEVEDPVENLLRKHFTVEPEDREHWTSTADILTTLQANGLQGNTRANSMHLASTLKKLGLAKGEQGKTKGYFGVW